MSDNEYVSRPDQEGGVPVQSDDAPVKDNLGADRDSDAALGMSKSHTHLGLLSSAKLLSRGVPFYMINQTWRIFKLTMVPI